MGGTLDLEKLNINVHNLPASDCTEGVICALEPLDISSQANPCITVRVPARIEDNGECTEGIVLLDQLAQAIGQCLGIGTIDTDVNVFTGTATSPDTAVFTVGEDGNDIEVFLRGENITFTGTGTSTDPLILTASSDTSIEEGVGISVTGSGTPADPFVISASVCDVPVLNDAEVAIASSVLVMACVDNETRLIPLPDPEEAFTICDLPVLTQGQVDAAASVLQAACVDGSDVLIPSAPAVVVDGVDFSCIPVTLGEPVAAPSDGSGPIRIDCDGSLWVYLCDSSGWRNITFGVPDLEELDPADVANICEELKFNSWYNDGDEGCPTSQREVSLEQLSALIQECICSVIPTSTAAATHAIDCVGGVFTRQRVFRDTVSSDDGSVSIEVTVDADGNIDYDLSVSADEGVFLERIQGALNGTITPDPNGDISFEMSDGTTWFLDFPIDELGVNGATMTLDGVAPGQGLAVGPRNITAPGIVYEDDPDNILTFTGGGVRVDRDGVYIIDTEIGGITGGFLESSVFVNGVNFGLGFPNSGSFSTANVLGIQQAVLRLSAGDIIRTGVGLNIGANPTVGNIAVTYLGA